MNESQKLIEALVKKENLVAMLAPSFPIVFNYPNIITRLKKLGFAHVVEVATGAKKTNEQILALLKKNTQARYITTPCPSIVRLIKEQFPQFNQYLTAGVDSPMAATAKIVAEHFPGHRPVFIGPCLAKKIEASADVPQLNILVLTFSELIEVFNHFGIKEPSHASDQFDIGEPGPTRLYPIDGGLSHSAGLLKHFPKGEILIVSGWENCLQAIKNFESNKKIRLLDILYCEAGCIGGPGIKSELSSQERKEKILDFWEKQG